MNTNKNSLAPLVDSHAHLELDPLINDCQNVMRRAHDAGLIAVITVGIDIDDARKAMDIARNFDDVFVSLGLHPHNANQLDDTNLAELERMATDPKVVGYGEIGLDFFRDRSPRDTQIWAFEQQIAVAKALQKPVVIHLRDAYDKGLSMLEKAAPFPCGGVIHCFSGSQNDALRALELGFYISIPGTVTYKKNDQLRSIVEKLPEDRILLETDCPFLSPEPLRGKDCEPAFIVHTAKRVADTRGCSFEALARQTTLNAINLFGLPSHILSGLQNS